MTEKRFAALTVTIWRTYQREKRLVDAAEKLTVPTTRSSRAQAGRIYKALHRNSNRQSAALSQLTEALYATHKTLLAPNASLASIGTKNMPDLMRAAGLCE